MMFFWCDETPERAQEVVNKQNAYFGNVTDFQTKRDFKLTQYFVNNFEELGKEYFAKKMN